MGRASLGCEVSRLVDRNFPCSGATGNDLFDVAIVSATEAWAVGEHGVILRHTDAADPPAITPPPTRTATPATSVTSTPTRTRTPTPPVARPLRGYLPLILR